jgi:hypothetical protein
LTIADDMKACQDAYVKALVDAVDLDRRWRWITVITGATALSVGALLGAWAANRSARSQRKELS